MTMINQGAQERIRGIYEANKKSLTPQMVLKDAKDPKSPLHRYFEWSDAKAAQLYRLTQARELIGYVVLEKTETREFRYAPSRASFVSLRDAVKSAPVWREIVGELDKDIHELLAIKEQVIQLAPDRLKASFEKFKTKTVTNLKQLERVAQAS